MTRLMSFAVLLLALPVIIAAQTSMTPALQNAPARKSPLSEYAGAWVGTFQGHAWLNIRLKLEGNQLVGTLERPHELQFDNDGSIRGVSDERNTAGVQNAVLQGDGLLLTVKDPGSQETDHYLMRLTGANTAEVKMVAMSMPPGMPKPKPWMLSRVGPSAVSPVR